MAPHLPVGRQGRDTALISHSARIAILAALIGFAACGGRDHAPPAEALSQVQALVRACHGPRTGAFGNVAMRLRDVGSEPAAKTFQVFTKGAKVKWTDGPRTYLARPDTVLCYEVSGHRIDLSPTQQQRAIEFAAALRGLTLHPLTTAETASWHDDSGLQLGEFVVRWASEGGSPSRLLSLEVSTNRDTTPPTVLEFLRWSKLEDASLPQTVRISEFGTYLVEFNRVGTAFPDVFFEPPPARTVAPTVAVDSVDACRWLSMPDPGRWNLRREHVRSAARRLSESGQKNAGATILVTDETGADRLVIPFVAVDPDAKPFVSSDPDELVVDVASHQVIFAEAPSGEPGKRSEVCLNALRKWLDSSATYKAASSSPRRIVNILSSDLARDPDLLRTVKLRVEWPIESI